MIIYKIQNKINDKVYIGRTIKDLNERISGHLISDSYIGRALRKYGLQCFDISVIDAVNNRETLNDKEIEYISFYNCKVPNGYNLTDGGEGILNPSDELRQRMSESRIGIIFSEEHKKNLSSSATGRQMSREAIEKRREKVIGRPAHNRGIPVTEEQKSKQSIAMQGKPGWRRGLTKELDPRLSMLEVTKKKISDSMKIYKAGQHENSLSKLRAAYTTAGGTITA